MARPDTHRDRTLRMYLADADELCPRCGYSLRGLQEPECPECGERLRLCVSLAEPRMTAFLSGLLGLAFGTGFFVLSLAVMAFAAAMEVGIGVRDFLPLVAGACACGLPLSLWIGRRTKLRQVRTEAVPVVIILCWAWPVMMLAFAAALLFL